MRKLALGKEVVSLSLVVAEVSRAGLHFCLGLLYFHLNSNDVNDAKRNTISAVDCGSEKRIV